MTNARRTNDFVVGAAVIGVLVLLLAAILWLKQADIGGRTGRVIVRTRDVGGVALGNPVVIRGVRAGRVESIALGERGWVVLELSIARDVPLPADPVVLLAAASLFGEWQATITAPGGVLPDIAQLTSVAGRIAGDVAQVAERVQIAFDDAAARELRESIRHFATLSSELSRTVQTQSRNLNRISGEVRDGVQSVTSAAATVDRLASRVDSATGKGELQEIMLSAREASRALLDATNRLRRMTEDVDRTQGKLSVAVSRADSVFAKVNSGQGSLGMLVNDPRLYRNSDSLVTELRSLVADVKQNPKRYINVRIF